RRKCWRRSSVVTLASTSWSGPRTRSRGRTEVASSTGAVSQSSAGSAVRAADAARASSRTRGPGLEGRRMPPTVSAQPLLGNLLPLRLLLELLHLLAGGGELLLGGGERRLDVALLGVREDARGRGLVRRVRRRRRARRPRLVEPGLVVLDLGVRVRDGFA